MINRKSQAQEGSTMSRKDVSQPAVLPNLRRLRNAVQNTVRRAVVAGGILTVLSVAGCQKGETFPGDELEIPNGQLSLAPKLDPVGSTPDTIQQVGAKQPREGNLALTLQVGDCFALRKTITQTLAQRMKEGPAKSTSRLQMTAGITVEKDEGGRRLLRVKYQRVRYGHDLLGDKVDYDSYRVNDQEPVPDAAILYHGMVNNGFAFWLTHDNQIGEVVDFREFLERCVKSAPPQRQRQLLAQVTSNPDDEGFANFVDDSIGLLRFNPEAKGRETFVKEGEEWQRTRKLIHPLPMAINTTYRLTELTDDRAKIEILGKIIPARVASLAPQTRNPSEAEIVLKDGHTTGTCTVDRGTGLPTKSQVTRSLALRVRMPQQAEFDQHKQIVTTVEIFPTQGKVYIGESDSFGDSSEKILQTDGTRSENDGVVPAENVRTVPRTTRPQTPSQRTQQSAERAIHLPLPE